MPEHGRRGVALVEQGRVELVEVLRTQPVEAVAAEPMVEEPVAISFDERGHSVIV